MYAVPDIFTFEEALGDIRAGRRSFPFYCLLVFTAMDSGLEWWVWSNWGDLDAMTGDQLLVFAMLGEPTLEKTERRGIDPKEAYAIAAEFDVGHDEIPCALLFTDPDSAEQVRWPIQPDASAPVGEEYKTVFRWIGACVQECASLPADRRLEALARELDKPNRLSPLQAVEEGAQRTSRFITAATTIGVAIGTVVRTVLKAHGAPL